MLVLLNCVLCQIADGDWNHFNFVHFLKESGIDSWIWWNMHCNLILGKKNFSGSASAEKVSQAELKLIRWFIHLPPKKYGCKGTGKLFKMLNIREILCYCQKQQDLWDYLLQRLNCYPWTDVYWWSLGTGFFGMTCVDWRLNHLLYP